MSSGVAAMLVAAALAPAGMTVKSSSHAAGAKNVAITVTMSYEMQCGYPGAGRVLVAFPTVWKVPHRLPKGTVLLNGKPVAATVSGVKVVVTVPPHTGMLCDVMGPGSLRISFTRGAGLDNPSKPGTYYFLATHAKRTFSTTYVVR